MKRLMIFALHLSLIISGCSSIKVIPEPVENAIINPADNSVRIEKNGIEIRVRPDASGLNAYNLESTVSSFNILIQNKSQNELAFTDESFVLTDEQGFQHSLLTPDKVREMLKKDSYYLMPYPYVGFYYLEDFQKTNFYNRFNSSLPYYYEVYPQDLFTKSLPLTTIIPGMMIEGQVYFKIDFAAHSKMKLLVYRKGALKSAQPDFALPFTIIK